MTELRHGLSFFVLVAGARLVASLPIAIAVKAGEFVGLMFGRVARDKRTMARRHAERVGIDPNGIEVHLDKTFRAYGRYWAEALWMRPEAKSEIQRSITHHGIEHVTTRIGQGMIFVLPHLGNWEFAGPLAESLGLRVVAVAENLANARIRDWFVGLRNRLGIDVVLATGSRQVMRDLEAGVASGAAVALLSDRDLKGSGVAVEFFGEETTLPAGAATLALRTGAPILPVAAYFAPSGGHHVVIRPEIRVEQSSPDRSGEIARVTQRIAQELEVLIAEAPEQWHLLQPNWPSDASA